jgi:hypothetical protein
MSEFALKVVGVLVGLVGDGVLVGDVFIIVISASANATVCIIKINPSIVK